MTLLLREGAWDGPHRGPSRDAAAPVLLSAHEPLPSTGKAGHKGWMRRLHLSGAGHADRTADRTADRGADEPGDNQREKDATDASPEIEPCRSKKHRFSLSRLFRPEDHDNQAGEEHEGEKRPPQPQRKGQHKVVPLEIPPLLLMNERNGGVTVSGRRVPFTRDAHKKKRRKMFKPLPRIAEDRALGQTSSAASIDAYRRRAYYPGKHKHKDKDKK